MCDINSNTKHAHIFPKKLEPILRRIYAYKLNFLDERLLTEAGMNRTEIRQAVLEFRRFLCLVAVSKGPLAVIGPKIDEVWHQFVLFTPQYRKFCEEVFGGTVDHQPNTVMTPVPTSAIENFLTLYKKFFGPLPAIWFRGMKREMRNYLKSQDFSTPPPVRWSGWTGTFHQGSTPRSHVRHRDRKRSVERNAVPTSS